jgi:hypothetical protein
MQDKKHIIITKTWKTKRSKQNATTQLNNKKQRKKYKFTSKLEKV